MNISTNTLIQALTNTRDSICKTLNEILSMRSITLIGQLVSKLAAAAATLDSDFLRKIPRARARARNRAGNPTHLSAAKRADSDRLGLNVKVN